LHKARHYRVRDFQGIHYKFGSVHPRFFIEPSTLNHFTPFRRFEKFGYSHLSAASFQPNGIADFERHCPFPPVAARDARFAPRLPWPPSPSELTCHRSRGCIKAGAQILQKSAREFDSEPHSCHWIAASESSYRAAAICTMRASIVRRTKTLALGQRSER